jgi:NAD(P)-dependent dehydrogenase (short-subunit alcohol dehydrogenase family)
MSGPLEGRVVAVAGATGGLGPSVVQALAAAGASLGLVDRDQGKLDAVVAGCGVPADRVDARVVDLLDEEQARGWAADLGARFGRVDGVAHLVGGWRGGTPLEEAPLDDWAFLHDLLIRTVQHTSRAFSEALRAGGHGRFVLVSSKQAQAPTHDNAAYAAAKAAAEAWTLALGDDFRKAGGDEGPRAAAAILVIKALVHDAMRAERPNAKFAGFTDAGELADAIAGVWDRPAGEVNGKRLWLTPES